MKTSEQYLYKDACTPPHTHTYIYTLHCRRQMLMKKIPTEVGPSSETTLNIKQKWCLKTPKPSPCASNNSNLDSTLDD